MPNDTPSTKNPHWLPCLDAAELLRMDARTLRRHAKAGTITGIRTVKVGRNWLFAYGDVTAQRGNASANDGKGQD